MKKTVLAATIAATVAAPAMANDVLGGSMTEHWEMQISYNELASELKRTGSEGASAVADYMTATGTLEERRETARTVIKEIVNDPQGNAHLIAAMQSISAKTVGIDGSELDGEFKSQNLFDSMIADAAAQEAKKEGNYRVDTPDGPKTLNEISNYFNKQRSTDGYREKIDTNNAITEAVKEYNDNRDPEKVAERITNNTAAINTLRTDGKAAKAEIAETFGGARKDAVAFAGEVKEEANTINYILDQQGNNIDQIYTNVSDLETKGEAAFLENRQRLDMFGADIDGLHSDFSDLETKGTKAIDSVNSKIDLLESDGISLIQEKADAAIEKSADKLYQAGSREVAKLESSLEGVNKGIRMDGEKAYNSLYEAGAREVAKSEAALTAVDKGLRADATDAINTINGSVQYNADQINQTQRLVASNTDDIRYNRDQADLAHRRVTDVEVEGSKAIQDSHDKLYAAGGREVAKLETALTATNNAIRNDGQAAYDKLYAAGAREVAKSEAVVDALNKKVDSLESNGIEYVQEKADAAVAKSADKLYEAGGREVAKLESSITAVDKGLRIDADKAYNNLADAGAREVANLRSV